MTARKGVTPEAGDVSPVFGLYPHAPRLPQLLVVSFTSNFLMLGCKAKRKPLLHPFIVPSLL